MRIAYLNVRGNKQKSEILANAYQRDIKSGWNKNKERLMELGMSETDYAAAIKNALNKNAGSYQLPAKKQM